MCFWAAFLLSMILRWLPPPPRVWSLAASFSCSASPKLACLEPGVSPGVGGCVRVVGVRARPCACKCVCRLRNCLLPAWPVRGGTEMVPLLALARPQEVTTLILFTVLLGHLFPPRRCGFVAFGWLPWWRRTLDYGKCFNHVCHYLCLLA